MRIGRVGGLVKVDKMDVVRIEKLFSGIWQFVSFLFVSQVGYTKERYGDCR